MTDLTEQWKKGELPEGFYWVKVKEEFANYPILADCVRRYEYYDVYTYFPEYEDSITSVLAPVPSYEEWQALNGNMDSVMQTNQALCKKLAELKEYERIVTSYNMKPIDYEIACETVNKLLDEKKAFKEQNAKLKELLKECKTPLEVYNEMFGNKEELLTKIDEVLNA